MTRVNVTLSPALLAQVDAEAKKDERSRSHMIERLVAEAIAARGEKNK